MENKLRSLLGVLCLLLAMALASCGAGGGSKPDTVAADTAKLFYDSLCRGGYEYFTDMTYQPERIPDGYRRQLVDNTKMYFKSLCDEHGGVARVEVSNCRYNADKTVAEAFLLLCFADSSKNEIVVPMTKHDGKWMMK